MRNDSDIVSSQDIVVNRDVALVEVLDRVINKGVVLQGDLTLSVAEVDLIYVGVKLVLCSVDRLMQPPKYPTAYAGEPVNCKPASIETPVTSEAESKDVQPVSPASTGEGLRPVLLDSVSAADAVVRAPMQPNQPVISAAPLSTAPQYSALRDSEAHPERGLAQLVLTVVELLRELMERQAVRRMENGTLDDAQIERMGENFMLIAERMEELKTMFGLTDDDLNLDLGPLGKLLD